jgi:hypothetical protein
MTDIADCYFTALTAPDAFFAKRLDAATWTAASDANQTIALQMATAKIDGMAFKGFPYLSTQARAFPRKYVLDPSYESPWGLTLSIDAYGYCYESSVPQCVLDACCLEALKLLEENASTSTISERELQEAGITSFSLGKLSVAFSCGAASRYSGMHSKEAYDLISKYLDSGGMLV